MRRDGSVTGNTGIRAPRSTSASSRDCPRCPQDAPKPPPRCLQVASKTPTRRPKRSPRRSQDAPRLQNRAYPSNKRCWERKMFGGACRAKITQSRRGLFKKTNFSETSRGRPKTPRRRLQDAPRRPKTSSRRPQDASRLQTRAYPSNKRFCE